MVKRGKLGHRRVEQIRRDQIDLGSLMWGFAALLILSSLLGLALLLHTAVKAIRTAHVMDKQSIVQLTILER